MATVQVTCAGCPLDPWRFIKNFHSENENFFEYLKSHGVLPTGVVCPKCDESCKYRSDRLQFYCGRYWKISKSKKRVQCNYSVSLYKGTFLDNTHLQPWEIGLLVIHWLEKNSATSKYNRGRELKSIWLFGGIERVAKKKFIVPLHQEGQDRSAATLIPIISKYIRAGSTVMSYGWAAYKNLDKEGYIHRVINHSENFMDPNDRSVHTQNIEREWRNIKEWAKRPGIRTEYFEQYFG
ncbi:uncharacterized protein [Macrobrachium rosenbergii]|uniref:uncharacterized protein n=1 Tax=Macrobrachium rosenbergii TaxID=79674 RepID=UPI0034D4F97A